MSGKWPGGIISKTAPTVTGPTDGEGGSASGIWTLDQAADYEKQGLWPKPVIPKEAWMWGYNNHGELGDSSIVAKSSPIQVGALTDWLQVSGGNYHTLAVKTDGTAWSWGENGAEGKLGLGNATSYSSPKQIGALTNWSQISAGWYASWAVKSDSTLWAWGNGGDGALGQGADTAHKNSPVQVGALTDWSSVAGGYNGFMAVKTDGTLWGCGNNSYGHLGFGNTTDISSPAQVGALTDWSEVSGFYTAMGAIKTDGTLWMWGRNNDGQLGDGSTTDRSSPVQIGSLTTWTKISSGRSHVLAIKTDGTLWAWGNGGSGRLGQGNTTDYSSPVQVGALTTWLKASANYNFSGSIKTDGTLWMWGEGGLGRTGHGNTTDLSSPVQVGALTTWVKLDLGSQFTAALKTP